MVAAVAIDFGVQANVVLGFRAIFALAPDARGRLNGVYLSTAFVGGAIGSGLGAWAYARGGWPLACSVGLAAPTIALVRFLVGIAIGIGLSPARHHRHLRQGAENLLFVEIDVP